MSKSVAGNMESSKGNMLLNWNHSGNYSNKWKTQLLGSIDSE